MNKPKVPVEFTLFDYVLETKDIEQIEESIASMLVLLSARNDYEYCPHHMFERILNICLEIVDEVHKKGELDLNDYIRKTEQDITSD